MYGASTINHENHDGHETFLFIESILEAKVSYAQYKQKLVKNVIGVKTFNDRIFAI